MTELVSFGETMLRLSPSTGDRLETARSLEFRTAGAESNVAVTAARLGTDATWLSKLPNSALGRRVTHELKSHGITPRICWSETERQGAYYIEHGAGPRETNVIYDRADAAVTTARPEELDIDAIQTAEVFYTSGITPALSDTLAETTAQLLAEAQNAGVKTVFDLNYRAKLWTSKEACKEYESLFPNIDVLVAAERDVHNVLNRPGDADALATELSADFDFETVIVTCGDEGAVAFHNGETYEQPAFETETLDPIGTGDAFVGAFLARRIDGDGVAEALTYAAATAALKRTIAGDLAVVTPDEVQSVINSMDDGRGISR